MNSVFRRRVIYGAIGVVLVVVLVMAFIPDPIPVEAVTVERGPMTVTIDSRGLTRVRDRYVLVAPVTGRLERMELREGDGVEKGQLVARLSSPAADPRQAREIEARVLTARAGHREAEADAARAAAALDLARTESARIERLAREGVVSREELDRARTAATEAQKALDAARARVASAAARVEAERAGLLALDPSRATDSGQRVTDNGQRVTDSGPRATDNGQRVTDNGQRVTGNGPRVTGNASGGASMEVRAPLAGRVFEVPERSGRMLQAGETIAVLGDARHLELVIDVLSEDAVKIRPGQAVVVEDWGGTPPLRGRVRLVEPAAYTKISALGIEEQRVDVIADLETVPPQVGDGYRVEARVVVWQSAATLKVPVSALFREGDAWAVFVVDGGRARRRVVRLDHRNDTEVEILSGLRAGERVIVHPADDIGDGVRVTRHHTSD